MDTIVAEALLDKNSETLFREDTRIWLVAPELSLSGVRHLETVITGPYLALNPGKGKLCVEFAASDSPPGIEQVGEGLNIVLETPGLGSLKKNSPVYYRQFQVGSVIGYKLSPTAQNVWIYINIRTPYEALVRENSRFWNVSGIRIDAGIFSGLQIDTESIESIITGGIAMATPETDVNNKTGSFVQNGRHFILHAQPQDKWLSWKPAFQLGGD